MDGSASDSSSDSSQRPFHDWLGNPLDKAPDRLLPSVSAIVLNDKNELLLLQRADNGHWAIPGGKMEIGESASAATIREVMEETGMDVAVQSLVGVYSDPLGGVVGCYPDGTVIHFVNLCFRCEITGGAPRGSDEGEEVGFFPLDDLPAPLLPPHRIRIDDALSGTGQAAIR